MLVLLLVCSGLRKKGYCQPNTVCNLHEGEQKAITDVILSIAWSL